MRRILIIGSGGAGKSTFARALGPKLDLPVIHLDAHFWHEGWVDTPKDEWREKVTELCAQPAWIMDGNYGGTMPQRLAACNTVIFLDLPRVVCLWRIVSRVAKYSGQSRPDMAPGCPEHISLKFLWWVLSYPFAKRPGILRQLAALPPSTKVIQLRSTRSVDEFLRNV